ncbi:MAG: hypothetical protein K2X84_13980, partial [Beijerinckiaceae bacterium]|nr:hypothetical protein [Beijerinckiaceae bacterium]
MPHLAAEAGLADDPARLSGPGFAANGPVTSLRDWLDRLSATGRLAVMRPGIGLRFELAAVSKRLDGEKATVFPAPDGHPV